MNHINDYELLWNYFQIHSQQRMSVFNFYIVITIAMFSSFGFFISEKVYVFGCLISILIVAVNFSFFKLDERTSFMIKEVEEKLREWEQKNIEEKYRIFSDEEKKFQACRSIGTYYIDLEKKYTYGEIFRFTFRIFTYLSIGCFFFSLLASMSLIGILK